MFTRPRVADLGSARVSRVGFGVSPKQSFWESSRTRDACAPQISLSDVTRKFAELAATRLLQRSSKLFRRVFAEFFLERRDAGEFCAITLRQGGIERLMPSEGVEELEEFRFVG